MYLYWDELHRLLDYGVQDVSLTTRRLTAEELAAVLLEIIRVEWRGVQERVGGE
jgi:hypothetical protein